MTQLEFSYSSALTNEDETEVKDAGMISFNVDFSEDPDSGTFKRICYSMALDEVTAVLAEKYGEEIFGAMPDISIIISGLKIA